MRYARQSKILEIIKNFEIDTQEKLVEKLNSMGISATQATVSRDIRELGLIKAAGKSGRNCYAEAQPEKEKDLTRFSKLLKDTVLDMRPAENLIVVRTLSGCAPAAAEVIDNLKMDSIVGTLAGDNTIFIAVGSKELTSSVIKKLNELISKAGA